VRKLQFLAGLAISALALYAALRDVRWRDVADALEEADYALVLAAAALLVLTVVLRALRWRLIIGPPGRPSLWHLFGCLNVAYFINNLLPFQLGDIGRAYLIGELSGISVTRSLSTVVVERVVDVLTLLLLLLALAPFMDLPGWVRAPAISLAAVFAVLAAGLIAVSSRRELVLRLARVPLRLAPPPSRRKLEEMVGSGLDGLRVLADARLAMRLLAVSVLVWLAAGVVVSLGLEAFDLDKGYDVALFLLIATTFGFFVPSSPGSVGVYHAIVIGALTSLFGVEKGAAVGFAFVMHFIFYLPPMVVAPFFLWRERAAWTGSGLQSKLRELRGMPAPEAHP